MNRHLFIHLFLLVALFVTNAVNAAVPKKRPIPTIFDGRCRVNETDVEQIRANVNPDPVVAGKNVTFSVSGLLSQDIGDNGTVLVGFKDDLGFTIGNVASAPVPPTKAGNEFSVDVTVEAPTVLTDSYLMQVLVVNPSNPPDPQKDIVGCTVAVVGTDDGPDSGLNGSPNKIVVSDIESFLIL
ncbi:19999_t:CDS:1 [Cetraspora pellucida]|uniref:19999_t:CDS:1 n=1 Tax=Cetraspora pellucida TaxID=1433469 RepID=A0A9N9BSB8_9GLOM|nr:19999_t:CDS:1 [Cetraspora pellucida]